MFGRFVHGKVKSHTKTFPHSIQMEAKTKDDLVDDDNALTIEANEVVKEIAFAVKYVEISSALPKERNLVHINLTTKENSHLCIELSLQGFMVVGSQFNEVHQQPSSRYYETIYSLLDSLSPQYRSTFCETLSNKLSGLQRQQEGDVSDDQMDTK